MKGPGRLLRLMLLLAVCVALGCQQWQIHRLSAQLSAGENDAKTLMVRAAEQAKESAVQVSVYRNVTERVFEDTFEDREGHYVTTKRLAAQASGVAVGEEMVVTCYHVVAGYELIEVAGADGEAKDAEVIALDAAQDLALLKVPGLQAVPAVLGDSDALRAGQPILCVGSPTSDKLASSVSAGVVSASQREIGSLNVEGETVRVFQTDTAINGGSSGGGVYNLAGELVGIVSRKYIGSVHSETQLEGIGMCIPINSFRSMLSETANLTIL